MAGMGGGELSASFLRRVVVNCEHRLPGHFMSYSGYVSIACPGWGVLKKLYELLYEETFLCSKNGCKMAYRACQNVARSHHVK